MAKLSVKEIQTLARKIVAESPGGVRYSALVQRIAPLVPTLHGRSGFTPAVVLD